jgi:SAM-dependent methyltransferase
MSSQPASATLSPSDPVTPAPRRAGLDLFLISLLLLFLELACIRWFPAHVLLLTFFTNTVLLACFLGMSVGCLTAGHRRNYLAWTPPLLLAVVAAHVVEAMLASGGERYLDAGQDRPQIVFFGAERHTQDLASFRLPVELVGGFFFLVIALALVGPGQELGRALDRIPDRVRAYTLNILGSVAGIALFALFSWLQLSPSLWFLPVLAGLAYFLLARPGPRPPAWRAGLIVGILALVLIAVGVNSGVQVKAGGLWVPQWLASLVETTPAAAHKKEHYWSPYYRIDYSPEERFINVNLIGHQAMFGDDYFSPEYALPYLLDRDARAVLGEEAAPVAKVLIIGAGSGNDVSRALQWGGRHVAVDAVEIDPVILGLGKRDHPLHPYQDERVRVHLDDGRNFLRSTSEKYDLIVYALVDSLVLHSSYSNIRLESYLFTQQAFADVKRCLKPGGTFVTYNYFRQGWIVARLVKGLGEVFGADNPLVLTFPYRPVVDPEQSAGGFTIVCAGTGADRLHRAFAAKAGLGEYWLPAAPPAPGQTTGNGFRAPTAEERRQWNCLSPEQQDTAKVRWWRFGPAQTPQPAEPLRTASDDWPFLYLRGQFLPWLSLRGMAVMAALALGLLWLFTRNPGGKQAGWSFDGRMFFLGAGFMLVETKAVVHMALLFGSTWMVNSVVFFAVLVMILLANLFVLRSRPRRLWPYYAGLLATLALNCAVPLDWFLGLDRTLQILGSCLLVFAPILFAGVIFAVSFARTAEPDRAFGANIAGAMLGGLAENTSMLLGFQYLVLVAIAFYTLSAFLGPKPAVGDKALVSP